MALTLVKQYGISESRHCREMAPQDPSTNCSLTIFLPLGGKKEPYNLSQIIINKKGDSNMGGAKIKYYLK